MRLDESSIPPAGLITSSKTLGPSRYLTPAADSAPAYASLLGTKPFELPKALSRTDGLPIAPRVALPESQRSQELRVTPDSLRYTGKTVDTFTTEIRGIQSAYRDICSRVELQKREFVRQQTKLNEIHVVLEKLKGARQQAAEERMRNLRVTQEVLLDRLDRVLQALMKRANPELSDHEKKWFDELKRMHNEVLGSGRYNSESLRTRLQMVSPVSL